MRQIGDCTAAQELQIFMATTDALINSRVVSVIYNPEKKIALLDAPFRLGEAIRHTPGKKGRKFSLGLRARGSL